MSLQLNRLGSLFISLIFWVDANLHPCPISKLLDGGTSCDVQVLWDGEEYLGFSPSYSWPTTTVFMPTYYQEIINRDGWWGFSYPHNFTLNVLQARIGKCKISLLFNRDWNFSSFLRNQSILLRRTWFQTATDLSLGFPTKKYVDSKNIHIFIFGESKALLQYTDFSHLGREYGGPLEFIWIFSSHQGNKIYKKQYHRTNSKKT